MHTRVLSALGPTQLRDQPPATPETSAAGNRTLGCAAAHAPALCKPAHKGEGRGSFSRRTLLFLLLLLLLGCWRRGHGATVLHATAGV